MNADIIVPALDFYPLEIVCGRTFDRREKELTARWNRSTGDERVAELRRIVGSRSRGWFPVPGRWKAQDGGRGSGAVARTGGRSIVEAKALASR